MKVEELIKTLNEEMPVKIVGEKASAYGFIRYENASWIGEGIKKREVKEINITGVENEFTVTVYGEI